MHKLLLLLAGMVLAFGAAIASCAMQTEPATKAPAAGTHKKADGKSMALLQFKRNESDPSFSTSS